VLSIRPLSYLGASGLAASDTCYNAGCSSWTEQSPFLKETDHEAIYWNPTGVAWFAAGRSDGLRHIGTGTETKRLGCRDTGRIEPTVCEIHLPTRSAPNINTKRLGCRSIRSNRLAFSL
jgi:hypothetical protein